jgi:soluble cytochrome b562
MHRAFGKDDSADSGERSQNEDRYQKLGKLADDRQQLADDLARLEKEMRDAESGLAVASNRPAASKLRDALGDLDESDLETRIQRSADRLRRGVNPDSNSGESEIASGLQHLGDQIGQARQALGNGEQQASESALDQVERLRNRLQALDRNARDGSNSTGRQGQPSQPGAGQGAGRIDDNGVYGGNRGGYSGDGRNNWWIDTGNNSTAGPKTDAPPPTSSVSSDPEAAYQQGLNDLYQLRQSVQDDPETLRQVHELIREMQRLDPKRFPGNPQLVEQLHAQVLNDVDKLELQLRRQADDKESGQIRSGDSLPVPSGYQDAVAEYFRRLSKRPPPAQ